MLLPWLGFLTRWQSFITIYMVPSKFKIVNFLQQFTLCFPSSLLYFSLFFFKCSSFYLCTSLIDICVCDRKTPINRFAVTYIFSNMLTSTRIYLRVFADNLLFMKSIGLLYSSASWLEREVYDMFGILFSNNNDLRRILTDYGFKGFPLRKDFPVVGFVEKQFSLSDNSIISRTVTFVQEFRFSD